MNFEELNVKYIDIRYEDEDECQAVYKSLTYDEEKHRWKISIEDYIKMTTSHY